MEFKYISFVKCPFVGLFTLCAKIGTLSIDNETDDNDVSKPNSAKGFVFGGEHEV